VVRVLYFVIYLLGVSWIRSCLWWTGLLCTSLLVRDLLKPLVNS
jgi:uncharacterized MAPEG superfamily protein